MGRSQKGPDNRVVQGVTGQDAFEPADDGRPEDEEIANRIEGLMADEFVRPAQTLSVQDLVAVNHYGVVHRAAPGQAHGPQGRDLMQEAITLEKEFIRDCLPVNAVGLRLEDFLTYIDYIADRRLEGVGLALLNPSAKNPLPWLAEMMDIKKEQNFFEGRVTEYQKASSLNVAADEEL